MKNLLRNLPRLPALLATAALLVSCASAVPLSDEPGEAPRGREPASVDRARVEAPRLTTEKALEARESWSQLQKSGRMHLRHLELDEAEDRFLRAFDLTRAFRPGDPRTATSVRNLQRVAAAHLKAGDSTSFARVMEQLVYICGEEPSARNAETARLLQELASTRMMQGRPTDARDSLLLALSILEGEGSDADPVRIGVHSQLGVAHLEAGNLDAAEAEIDEAARMALAAGGERSPAYAKTLVSRSKLERARNRPEEAREALAEALEITEEAFGLQSAETARVVREVALFEQATGRNDDAERHFDRVIAIWDAIPNERFQRAQSRNELAWFLVETGQPEHAEAPARSALGMLEEQGRGGQPLAAVADTLATALRDQEKYADAEPLYQEALLEGAKADRLAGWGVADIAERYAEMLDRMGREADARDVRQRWHERDPGAAAPEGDES